MQYLLRTVSENFALKVNLMSKCNESEKKFYTFSITNLDSKLCLKRKRDIQTDAANPTLRFP